MRESPTVLSQRGLEDEARREIVHEGGRTRDDEVLAFLTVVVEEMLA